MSLSAGNFKTFQAFKEKLPKIERKDPVSSTGVEEEYGVEVKGQNDETGRRTLKKATAPQVSYLVCTITQHTQNTQRHFIQI